MKKNELIRSQGKVYRVLDTTEHEALVIDCLKLTMPKWMDISDFVDDVSSVDVEELYEITDLHVQDVEDLTPEENSIAHKRFTMIADIVAVIGDRHKRSRMISEAAAKNSVTKQTIRKYLCLFLSYQSIAALSPRQGKVDRPLTQDEKNMRWGLNKFFYTMNKNSLPEAYTMLIKARYTDEDGKLLSEYPTFHQFRYFYRKTRKLQTFYISRDGLKDYQRNNRPLTGDGVQEYANHVGIGMLDSTVCDIFLVNDAGELVGRPLFTAAVDAYSGVCMGYTLSWEGGVYSLKELMSSMLCDKVEHCREHGIIIDRADWDISVLPGTMVTDKGKEYTSDTFSQLTELGITLVDLPAYRPELKGVIEKFFDLIQESFKPYLKGKGLIEADYQERGAHDYRKDACLTIEDFEAVIIRCILYYNNSRIVENYPFTEEMLASGVKPFARDIWNYGRTQESVDLIEVSFERVMMTLLPRTKGTFTRYGLKVNKLRYHCDGFTEEYLKGGDVTVAYNPDDVSSVWLFDKGEYIEFALIESRFEGMSIESVTRMKKSQREAVRSEAQDNLQARIDLARHIQTITEHKSSEGRTKLGGVTKTKKKERVRKHKDFLKEV